MKTIKLLILLINLVAIESLWAQIKIMPLGDSITYDSRINETRPTGLRTSYRQPLWLDLKNDGYDVDFVGSQIAGQDAVPSFDTDNEGHPGWHADGDPGDRNIATHIYGWLSDHPADVILLHIGTNDISGGQEPAEIAADIERILDEINRYETDKNVEVWVIIARIISRTDSMKLATTALNNQIQVIANPRIAEGDKIIVVDMENDAELIYNIDTSAPYTVDMYDTVHPNDSGYQKMAATWLADGLLTIFPYAVAGADQNVNEKTLVTLDGSGSDDPDTPAGIPLDYLWEQKSGTSVELSDPSAQKPIFTAPAVGSSGERLNFKLTVKDADGFENSDTVSININNVLVPPSADAGSDQNVVAERTVTLEGSNSFDPDGMISVVQWKQISGKNLVTLTIPDNLTTQFTAPAVDAEGDMLMFKLTVIDNDGLTGEDTVNVKISPTAVSTATSNSGGSSGGGCFIQTVIN